MIKKTLLIILFFISSLNITFASYRINKIVADRVKAVSTIEINYDTLNKQLSEIETKLLKKNITIEDTNNYIKILNSVENLINEANKEDETNLNYVKKRIESLGEKPTGNLVEDKVVVNKRKEFAVEENLLKTKITKNDLILAKLNELETLILNFRNQTLLDNILNRQSDLVKPTFLLENTKNFASFVFDILKLPYDWYKTLNKSQQIETNGDLLYLFLISSFLLFVALSTSLIIKKYYGYKKTLSSPDYIKKTKTAIIMFISNIIISSTIIVTFFLFFTGNALMENTELNTIFAKLFKNLMYIFVLSFLVKAIFVPHSSTWRLFNINNNKAKSITFISILSIALIFTFNFFEYSALTLEYPIKIIFYIKLLSCLTKILCIALIAKICFYEEEVDEEHSAEEQKLGKKTKIKLFLYLFSIILFSVCFFGYVNLAYYILNKSIISIIFACIAYIISNIANVAFHNMLLLKFWTKTLKLTKKQLVKINIWFSLIINPIILVILVFILLGLWGFSTDLLLQNIKRFLNGFYVGDVKISIIAICLAIMAFFVSLSIFKIVKIKLLAPALSKTDMDIGIRDSLTSGFSFFGFLVSIFLAIAVAGGNLSNLAIVAGALSFGAGLGLQNIVNNLVSGILILFERPIKIGDIVNINGQEGKVKQINIRSTQLETFTKSNIIIPNSNIVSEIVLNKTLNNKQARLDLNFGISPSNDPQKIIDLLLEIVSQNEKILEKPEPFVAFNGFSRNNIDMTLKIYIEDVNNQQSIMNEILLAIFYKFKEKKIELSKEVIYIKNEK